MLYTTTTDFGKPASGGVVVGDRTCSHNVKVYILWHTYTYLHCL